MPTYDYQCKACGHEFELFQQMSDSLKRKCPKCGKPKLERLIGTGAGVLFKGGGFYETDYRSESYKQAAEAYTKSTETKTGAKAETKSDAATSSSTPAASDTPASTSSSSKDRGASSKSEKKSSKKSSRRK